MSTLSTSKGESPAGPVLVMLLSVRRARSIPGHEQIRTSRHRRFLWLAHRPARTDQGAARHAGESGHPRTARPPPPGALAPQGRDDGSRMPASQVRKNLSQRREGAKEDRKRKTSLGPKLCLGPQFNLGPKLFLGPHCPRGSGSSRRRRSRASRDLRSQTEFGTEILRS